MTWNLISHCCWITPLHFSQAARGYFGFPHCHISASISASSLIPQPFTSLQLSLFFSFFSCPTRCCLWYIFLSVILLLPSSLICLKSASTLRWATSLQNNRRERVVEGKGGWKGKRQRKGDGRDKQGRCYEVFMPSSHLSAFGLRLIERYSDTESRDTLAFSFFWQPEICVRCCG